MSILDRYMFSEFFKVLGIGTISIVGVFLGTGEFQGAMSLLSTFDVPLQTMLMMTLLQIPSGALYALPAGLLFSTMFVLFRLNRDYELTALNTFGVSMRRVLFSFVLIGLACSVLCLLFAEYVAPQSKYLAAKVLRIAVQRSARPYPKKNKIEVTDECGDVVQVLILGSNLEHRTINGFLFFDLTKQGTVSVIWSRFCQFQGAEWKLSNGRLFDLLSPNSAGDRGTFESMSIPGLADSWQNIDGPSKTGSEKSISEIKAEIDGFARSNQPAPKKLLLAYYRQFAQALSCVLLILAAAPIALMERRRTTKTSLFYGALVVPLYFILQQVCHSMCTHGAMEPALAAFLPSTMLAALGAGACALLKR